MHFTQSNKKPSNLENFAAMLAGCLLISAPVVLAGLGFVRG
jgi:hypothetical protein